LRNVRDGRERRLADARADGHGLRRRRHAHAHAAQAARGGCGAKGLARVGAAKGRHIATAHAAAHVTHPAHPAHRVAAHVAPEGVSALERGRSKAGLVAVERRGGEARVVAVERGGGHAKALVGAAEGVGLAAGLTNHSTLLELVHAAGLLDRGDAAAKKALLTQGDRNWVHSCF
jgi:hypothetical protein